MQETFLHFSVEASFVPNNILANLSKGMDSYEIPANFL
jgi:hypothetical protein